MKTFGIITATLLYIFLVLNWEPPNFWGDKQYAMHQYIGGGFYMGQEGKAEELLESYFKNLYMDYKNEKYWEI